MRSAPEPAPERLRRRMAWPQVVEYQPRLVKVLKGFTESCCCI
jgi:hypothetical protein